MKLIEEKKITLHNSRKKKNAQKNIKKKKINLENKNEQKYWRRMKLYCFKKKSKKNKNCEISKMRNKNDYNPELFCRYYLLQQ